MVDYITHEVVWLAVGLWFIYILYVYLSSFGRDVVLAASKCDQTASAAERKKRLTKKIDARLGLRRVNEEDYKTLLVQSTFVC